MINRPTKAIGYQNRFNDNEVGLTHPETPGFIKIADNGDIYIMCNPNVGIILSAAKESITLVGDTVKVVTKEDAGFKWNELSFNAKATKYSEPTFIIPKDPYSSIYDDIDNFV